MGVDSDTEGSPLRVRESLRDSPTLRPRLSEPGQGPGPEWVFQNFSESAESLSLSLTPFFTCDVQHIESFSRPSRDVRCALEIWILTEFIVHRYWLITAALWARIHLIFPQIYFGINGIQLYAMTFF